MEKIIGVPTGLFGLGAPRLFLEKDVRIISVETGSTSDMCGIKVVFNTKAGETLCGYHSGGTVLPGSFKNGKQGSDLQHCDT